VSEIAVIRSDIESPSRPSGLQYQVEGRPSHVRRCNVVKELRERKR